MVTLTKTRLAIALFIVATGAARGQLNAFLYAHNSLINLNPSFSGSNGNLRDQGFASVNAPGLKAETRTFYNTVDMYLPSIESGFAFTAFHENFSGARYQNSLLSVSYAKYLSLRGGRIKFIPSLQAGFGHVRIRIAEYISQPGPGWFWEERTYTKNQMTIALGGLFTIKNFYFGASFYNFQLLTRREQYNPLLDRYNVHASYNLRAAKWALLHFSGNFRVSSFSSSYLNLGLNILLFNHVLAGAGIVPGESYFLSAGYRGHCFSLRVGYDNWISRLIPYKKDGWTAMATFNLRKKELRKEVLNFEAW